MLSHVVDFDLQQSTKFGAPLNQFTAIQFDEIGWDISSLPFRDLFSELANSFTVRLR
jgi:hypothetical protein